MVTVDLATSPGLGTADRSLIGLGWNHGDSLAPVEGLRPPVVRIDAALDKLPASWTDTDLEPLRAKVGEVRRIGATPQVILSYMPAWLANEPYGRDPSKLAPRDLDAWHALIVAVVTNLAETSPGRLRFEVWNEPDVPVFWQDSPAAFLDLAVTTHRAVADVKVVHPEWDLEVGGPAAVAPEPALMVAYVKAVADAGLPLDFVSWHYYANHPFLGPDGNEGFVPEPVYRADAHRNPTMSPAAFGAQVPMVRAWVGAALTGTGLDPEYVIDEWNVAAGGYDLRHDSHEGAALAAGALIEMERSGLDGADFYRAVGSDTLGDWGMTTASGGRKPVWWVFDAWSRMAGGPRLAVAGDDPATGLWARATRASDGTARVLLATFLANGGSGRPVTLALPGCTASTATVTRFDDATPSPTTVPLAAGSLAIEMPDQTAVLVEVPC